MYSLKKHAAKSIISVGLAMLGCVPLAAANTQYPSSPVTMVVPYAPGGTTDIVFRIVATELGNVLGQPVIVENRSGAGGMVGTDYAARQKPDGYTLVTGNIGPISTSPSLYEKLAYDPVNDFIPIRNVIDIPNVILVPNDSPLKTVEDLLAYNDSEPIFYASPGTSTSPHLTAEMFAMQTGIPLEHVSYKGSGPALTDLMAGHVPLMFDNLPASIGHVKSGSVRALAVTTEKRLELLPDVPTLKESGVEDFVVTGWIGILVPAGTPEPIVTKLYTSLEDVLNNEAIRQRITSLAAEIPTGSDPKSFAVFIQDEINRWREVITTAQITVN